MAYSRSLTEEFDYIAVSDPALDGDEPEKRARHKEYRETYDRSVLVFKEGATPAVWRLTPLSRTQFLHCFRQVNDLDKYMEAVAFGLRSVSGFLYDGKPVAWKPVKSDLGERVASVALDKIFDPLLVTELGDQILAASSLRPSSG